MGRLFWKIFLGFWLTLVLIAIGVGLAVHFYNQSRIEAITDLAAGPRANFVVNATALALAQGGPESVESLFRSWPGRRLPLVLIVDEAGKDIFERPVPSVALERAREQLRGAQMLSGVRRVLGHNGHEYVIFIPQPNREAQEQAQQASRSTSLSFQLVAALIASLLFSAVLAWYLTRPVRHLQSAANRLARGELATRVMPRIGGRRDEIADLGRDFDHMAAQLQALVSAQQRLLHDVSHELRSPLARLQVAVGLGHQQPDKLPEMLARIEHETGRLDELVGELLTLSRLEAHVDSEHDEPVDVSALLETVVEDARFEAEAAGRGVKLSLDGEASLVGKPELLRRAFENVVRNAVRYTAPGTSVSVSVKPDLNAAEMVIRVCDRGPGVASADLATIFEPFVRAGEGATGGRDGYGLGLAIAKRAVMAHGGRVAASNREEGGLCIALYLPLSSSVDKGKRPTA
ncbi:ATP-binding protein [Thiohalophilus thiocyanatoxydans]|uniref:histidine kinase n=1 Tax=Thiohalophilus thiocyanatoxydans TaxID=381308 RepID=A0A4R8IIN8_9GAMM|nr:ATP-binding protein [Thiohalophilus thiocyanatoxydans]TDY00521.1 two-component system OmpR family sensor kinase [Thiohalophilus thiocyanatoxydans]